MDFVSPFGIKAMRIILIFLFFFKKNMDFLLLQLVLS